MTKILIKNGCIWDGERFFHADILTVGEVVAKIEPDIADEATYTYDAKGMIVSAGLVDTHVHMRVHPSDEFGTQAEMSCFPFGVTAAADAGRTYGERAIVDSFMLKNVVFMNARIRKNQADLAQLEESVNRFGDKAVGIKVYFDTDVSEVSDSTPLTQVCRFAKAHGLRVMVHCSNSPCSMSEILNILHAGDILTHAFHGGRNNAAEDRFESCKAAQARGVTIDTGFAGPVHTDFSVFGKAIECNLLPDTISTDITKFSAYTRGGRYGMTMCISMARHMGMRETDILKAVTSAPARALGKADEWGFLKIGRKADIAVLEYTDEGFSLTDRAGNHIESDTGYRCVLTVSDGRIVYKH